MAEKYSDQVLIFLANTDRNSCVIVRGLWLRREGETIEIADDEWSRELQPGELNDAVIKKIADLWLLGSDDLGPWS
jgi:hypothetical protein